MNLPPLSEIRAASWDYLRANAAAWTEQARTWEAAFTEVRDASMHPGGTEWTGPAAEAFQHRADTDLVAVRGPVDMLENAAAIATRGADAQEANQRRLLDAVDEVQSEGYQVAEDYTVTDTRTDYSGPDEYFARKQAAEEHTNYLKSLAQGLVTHEDTIARQLTTATAGLHDFAFPGEGEDGGAGGPPHVVLVDGVLPDPTINGPGSEPRLERPQLGAPYDLGATIPGTGILITGDPESGKPKLVIPGTQWNGDNPFPVDPGYRALPTGTAVGPDGQQYAFYSVKPYGEGTTPDNYIAAESHVQNLADPTKDLGPLRGTVPGSIVPVGISQASGVYDPKTQRMVIVGNLGQDGQRALWESAPIRPGDSPNAWMGSMHQVGTFDNLGAANRENQIVSLPQGGYLLTSAANGEQVLGVAAASPNGLLTAPSHEITGPGLIPSGGNQPAFPYGPTIVGTDVLPNGQEQVTMRVSTWPVPQGWQFGPDAPPVPYHPHTYTTTFGVSP